MIGRRRFAAAGLLTFTFGFLLCHASTVRGAGLPVNVRQAINPGPVLPQIDAFIREKLAVVAGEDYVAQSKARDELIGEMTGAPEPTPQFRAAYAGVLNTALLDLLKKNEDPRVRLNAAVIAARVAELAGSTGLAPVTLVLLAGPSEGTQLWALKTAGAVLPHAIAGGPNGGAAPMIAAVVKIGSETQSGPIVRSVYDALTIEKHRVPGSAWAGVLSASVPALHQVMQARIARYSEGIPEEPLCEGTATIYLTSIDVWPAQAAKQQFDTIQIMSDLMGVAAQRTVGASNEERQDLITLIRRISKAIDVAGTWPPANPALTAAGKVTESLPLPTPPDEVVAKVAQAFKSLQAVKGFEKLRPPPDVDSASTAATTNTK